MAKWLIYNKKADFNKMAGTYGIDPVLARILVNRGIKEPEEIQAYLHPERAHLHDGKQMQDMDRAVGLVQDAIQQGTRICIAGDYDIDGIEAVYLLHQGLLRLGARVDYAIPHRVTEGYGISVGMMERFAADGVGLVLTCDNGISAVEAVERAKALGMTVVITDHHEVPYEACDGKKTFRLPPADAVVNPKRPDCPYPFKKLCGAAVAWKLVEQLYASFGIPKEESMAFLEHVAFATIGDVMELVGENRTIVSLGLQQLRHTKNIGMQTLMARCSLTPEEVGTYDVGFRLGPCFNASGRLDKATRGLELLEAETIEEAARLAGELQSLNEERKAMTEAGVKAGISYVDTHRLLSDTVLVVYLPNVHESVAGIVAGRLREKYARPVFVLVDGAKEGQVKGSGRSMEGYSMYEELCKCRELLVQFGGHPMAAGLSMAKDNLAAFCRRINEVAEVTPKELLPVIHIDAAMPFGYITKELIRQLLVLEPFGNGNPRPVFAQKDVRVKKCSAIGTTGVYRRLLLQDAGGTVMEGVYFGDGRMLDAILARRGCLTMTYEPQLHTYRGREDVQIVVKEIC